MQFSRKAFRRSVDDALGLGRFRSGLWRIEPPWWMAIWTLRFWRRQVARYKIWRATGHHFLWNRRKD
jgi:hypothetical protein